MKVAMIVLASAALALAEPPVPSSQYLPSNQYGPPRGFTPPSNQYGAPAQTQAVIRPNSQYGAPNPNSNYLPPSGNGGYNGGNGNGNGNGGYPGGKGGYDDQSEPANYNFEYHVQDDASGNDFGHEESRQGDVAQGKYFVLLPDGRRQTVEYTADNEGYKPKISYEQVSNGIGNGGGNGGYSNGGYSNGGGGNGNGNGGYQY